MFCFSKIYLHCIFNLLYLLLSCHGLDDSLPWDGGEIAQEMEIRKVQTGKSKLRYNTGYQIRAGGDSTGCFFLYGTDGRKDISQRFYQLFYAYICYT